MPIYDYRCGSCGNRFEVRQSFSDHATAACPQCQGAAQRVLHPVGIVFKGSGWHSTDYRSRSGSSNGAGSSSSESAHETNTEAKSEEKKSETSKTETSGASTGS